GLVIARLGGFFFDARLETVDLGLEVMYEVNVGVEHDLVGGAEPDAGEPFPVLLGPVGSGTVGITACQQQLRDALFGPATFFDQCRTASNQCARRLEFFVRHVDGRKQSGCVHRRQLMGVDAVGLDAVPAAARNRRGGNDVTGDVQLAQEAEEHETAGGGLVAAVRFAEAPAHVGDHLADGRRLVLQRALKKYALDGGVVDADRDRVFVNVETNDDVCNRISRAVLIHRTVPFGAFDLITQGNIAPGDRARSCYVI